MKFCIIDVSNLVHRAKHGVGKSRMGNPYDPFGEEFDEDDDVRVGMIMNVVFDGMISAFTKFECDHAVAAFDTRSWRRDYYEDYKANRRDKERTPTDIADQQMIEMVIDQLKTFLKKYTNVTVLEADGAEADDFIARWVQIHDDPFFSNMIFSGDGDFKQLVRDNVELYNPLSHTLYTTHGVYMQDGKKKKKTDDVVELYGKPWKVVKEKDGTPKQIDSHWELFEKCIRGDTSDNIPSAYPRVRTTQMQKAFHGNVEQWNNFINSTWGKDGEKHSVKELYERNRVLIDLTRQPFEVVEMIDEAIADALEVEPAKMIGAYFANFCSKYKLAKLVKRSDLITNMLTQGYEV